MIISKYFRIYKLFFNNSVSWLSQYRKDTWFNLILNLSYIGMLLLIVEVIFGQTQSIAGWLKEEVYILTLVWSIVDEIFVILFGANIHKISNLVMSGDFDLILTKPINKLFFVSCSRVLIRGIYRLLTTVVLLIIFVIYFGVAISLLNWLVMIVLMICGVVVMYSLYLFFNIFGFWFDRIENINEALNSINTLGRYPLKVFPRVVRVIALTVVPIGLVAYVPVSAVFDKISLLYVLLAICWTAILLLISIIFWKIAIKRYSSASS